jgi:type I restriction enzyme S subunit
MSSEAKPLLLPLFASSVMANWSWERLDSIADVYDCPHSTPKLVDDVTAPFVVRSQDVRSGTFLLNDAAHVSSDTYAERIKRVEPRYGDLVYSREGTYFGIAAIVPKGVKVCLGQRMVLIRPASATIDHRFLQYWLNSPQVFGHIHGFRDGTVAERLNLPVIRGLAVAFPGLAEQRSIAETLTTIDDRITLLRETNATLEAIAQALFKSWFVDFDPVRAKLEGRVPEGMDEATAALFSDGFEESELGLVPKGWRVGTIGEHTSYLNRGISPKYIEDGGIVVINQKCIRDFSLDLSKARRHDPAQRKIDGRELLKGDILVNSTGVGTLGRVAQVLSLECPAIVDSHVTVMRAGPALTWNYLGLSIMRRQPEIESMGEGSTGQTELSRGKLAALKLLVPSAAVLTEFDKIALPLRERFSENQSQAKTLASLRDSLLPRLISGQFQTPSNSNEEEEAQIG